MDKEWTRNQARNTLLTWGQKDIHGIYMNFQMVGVPKISVSKKKGNLTHSFDCLLISCIREVRTVFGHQRRVTSNFFYYRYLWKRQEQFSYRASDKNSGVQNDPRGTGIKMSSKKILFDAVLIEKFDVQNRLFSVFSKKSKSGHFVLQISPWKQHPLKKWSTPRESQWKIQQNCRLRFFIFEILSQRFFTTKFHIIIKKLSSVTEVFKETIAAFKRLNRYSLSICQNKDDKSPNILVYLVALTKIFDKMFLALQKSRSSKFLYMNCALTVLFQNTKKDSDIQNWLNN